MKVLVIGAAGQLGLETVRELVAGGHDVVAATRTDIDLGNPSRVEQAVEIVRPAVIVNCAAYNDVDAAETHPSVAMAVNALALRYLSAVCDRSGIVLVHFGTDFVFDGRAADPYREGDSPNPLNVYGQSKLAGEDYVLRGQSSYVLRLSSVFGAQNAERGTLNRMASRMMRGDQVGAHIDRFVTPSYAPDVAVATRILLERRAPFGLYHCVASGVCTWFEMVEATAAMLHVKIRPLPTSVRDHPTTVPRPVYCALSNEKLESVGIQMPHWTDALRRHIARSSVSATYPRS